MREDGDPPRCAAPPARRAGPGHRRPCPRSATAGAPAPPASGRRRRETGRAVRSPRTSGTRAMSARLIGQQPFVVGQLKHRGIGNRLQQPGGIGGDDDHAVPVGDEARPWPKPCARCWDVDLHHGGADEAAVRAGPGSSRTAPGCWCAVPRRTARPAGPAWAAAKYSRSPKCSPTRVVASAELLAAMHSPVGIDDEGEIDAQGLGDEGEIVR